ncbi:MAG: 30S ribosomal protein S17 [Actinomycetes bacterium]
MADETENETTEETPAEPETEATEVVEAEVAAEPQAVEEPAADETPVEEPVTEAADEAPAAEVEEPAAAEEAADAVTEEAAPAPEAAAAPEPAAAPAAPPEPKKKRKRLPRALRHKHSKPERVRAEPRKPITRTAPGETEPGRRQERRGVVVSDKENKTIVVKVDLMRAHPKYKKVVRRSRKFHAHDEENSASIGDVVRIIETRPLSKLKNWRLAEIVEKAR